MNRGDGTWFVISVDNDRLVALHAKASGGSSGRVRVLGCVSQAMPAGLDQTKPGEVGAWMAKVLKEAGLESASRRGRVVFAVPRSEVMLKRVVFPAGTDSADRPEMVRLQMIRQVTLSPETAVIDYADADAVADGRKPVGAMGVGHSVLAGALQAERIAWRRSVAQAAGMRIAAVSLKASGVAAIVADVLSSRGGESGGRGAMGITLGCGTTEFVVIENGQLVFARGSDLIRPDPAACTTAEEETFADKVAVEAKRTWMSYRSTPESVEVETVLVLGGDRCASVVAQRCRESMECRAESTALPAYIELEDGVKPEIVSEISPLVGLVAEGMHGKATLDFANPRKTPDVGAARRQRVLLGALAAILVLGGAYTYTRLDLNNRERRKNQLAQEWGGQSAKYADFVRLKAKAAHVSQWRSARFDWLAHIGFLNEQLPGTNQAILDGISARGEQDVLYTKSAGENTYSATAWSSRLRGTFMISGKVKRREIADDLRLSIVDDKRYTLDSKGADTADRFDWRLITTRARPDDDGRGANTAPASQPASGSGTPTKKPAGSAVDTNKSGGGA